MAAKHNRIHDFKECTLFRLIEAAAALYLLNLVFVEDVVLVEEGLAYPNELDSDVFVPTVHFKFSFSKQDKGSCVYELISNAENISTDRDNSSYIIVDR